MKINACPEAKQVAKLFFPTSTAFLRLLHGAFVVPSGLTSQQMKIIMEIHIAGKLRLSDLSRCAGVTHGTMTVAVQKLLKKGLVVKTKDLVDERAISLALTPAGKKTVRLIEKGMEEFFHSICEGIAGTQRKKLLECYRFLLATYSQLGE